MASHVVVPCTGRIFARPMSDVEAVAYVSRTFPKLVRLSRDGNSGQVLGSSCRTPSAVLRATSEAGLTCDIHPRETLEQLFRRYAQRLNSGMFGGILDDDEDFEGLVKILCQGVGPEGLDFRHVCARLMHVWNTVGQLVEETRRLPLRHGEEPSD